MGELLGTSISRKLNLVLKIVVAMVVAFALATIVAPATEANAAAKKQTVTTTIKMGNKGCDCPELTFVKVVKKGQKATKTVVQAVSKWTIDGKVEKKPFDRFYAKGWKFSKHNINVVMKTKLAPGTYKVYVDNGTTKKKVGTVKVAKKAVAKTVKYA
jgi:hypothetical protein